MILTIKGILNKKEIKDKLTRVNINGLWMTAWTEKFPEFPFEEGDYVEGTYVETQNKSNAQYPYLNLETLEKKNKPNKLDERTAAKDQSIMRQACFKAACDAYEWDHKKEPQRQIDILIEIAKAGEEYVLRKEVQKEE